MSVASKRSVRVQLHSVQTDPYGDTCNLVEEYAGHLYDRPSERYIVFEEPGPRVTTAYKIKPGELHITRRGTISGTYAFREGDWDYCQCEIAEGWLDLRSRTRHLESRFDDGGGHLHLEYELWSGEELLGDFKLKLVFESLGEAD